MPIGTLRRWDAERGFGFVTDDSSSGQTDMFIHVRQMHLGGVKDPQLGDVFEYGIGVFNGRNEAVSIARIDRVGE